MNWRIFDRFDPDALPLADRHYNRQTPGSPQLELLLPQRAKKTVIYASRTGTRRTLALFREWGWRILVSARGCVRSEGFVDYGHGRRGPRRSRRPVPQRRGCTKPEVVQRARELGIRANDAWSCYGPGPQPCKTCPSCVQRDDAERTAAVAK